MIPAIRTIFPRFRIQYKHPIYNPLLRFFSSARTPHVRVFDTSARDGIQAIQTFIPTSVKIQFINRLTASGLSDIEIASVTKLPQMRDAEEVFKRVRRSPYSRYWVLTLNEYGLNKVIEWGGRHVGMVCSASDSFSLANTKASIDDAFKRRHIPLLLKAHKCNVTVRAYLSCCFGFKDPNEVSEEQVIDLCQKYADLGARMVICDTTSLATPEKVTSLFKKLIQRGFSPDSLGIHFHGDGQALIDNIDAALKLGIKEVDTSLKGLGGCPAAKKEHAKKLSNAPTEEVVQWLHNKGVHTGVNLSKLTRAQEYISENLQ